MEGLAQTNLQLYLQVSAWDQRDRRRLEAAYRLATNVVGDRYRESGKPFVDHLVGSASALLLDGADPDLVTACLLHAIYDAGRLDQGDVGVVSDVVGEHAANLALAYSLTRWYPDLLLRAENGRLQAPDDAVLAMRVANELDDWIDNAMAACNKRTVPAHTAETALRIADVAHAHGRPTLASRLRDEISRTTAPEAGIAPLSRAFGPLPMGPSRPRSRFAACARTVRRFMGRRSPAPRGRDQAG